MSLPKKITVIGSGGSGIEAARYCAEKGCSVILSDTADTETVQARVEKAQLTKLIRCEGDGHSEDAFECDLMVVSPGVPATAPIFEECQKRKISVIGEVELGYRESVAQFVAVTGSAGKSTTVSLINTVLNAGGKETALCGNIGTPVVEVAPKLSENGIAVVEVSSFQLETIETFAPKIAVILNLAPNHLDRHASLEEYYSAKFEIVRNMKDGLVILGVQDELLVFAESQLAKNRVLFFGKHVVGYNSVIDRDGNVVFIDADGKESLYSSLGNLQLTGEHNVLNALVAAACAREMGIAGEEFAEGIAQFGGLAHRMERVGSINGIACFNDSKATTPESMAVALNSFASKSVLLIAGGKDKGGDFRSITSLVAEKCRFVFLIGTASEKLANTWSAKVPVIEASDLRDAILRAMAAGYPGDILLLSPGCASFDMFKSFEDRGDQFRAIIQELDDE